MQDRVDAPRSTHSRPTLHSLLETIGNETRKPKIHRQESETEAPKQHRVPLAVKLTSQHCVDGHDDKQKSESIEHPRDLHGAF